MKIVSIEEIDYDDYIYTPQVKDNENYLFENGILNKNCQNVSIKTGLLVLSRLDKDCKIIICGSNRQIDNPYVNRYNNGLSLLLNSAYEKHKELNISAVNLIKTVRGPMAEFAERVLKV
jgi:phoH family protein